MRELPEFQVLANHLHTSFRGKILLDFQLLKTKKIKNTQNEFDELKGNILKSVYRYGKEIHLRFNNTVVGINLMLHGNLQIFEGNNQNKFTIAELRFDDGRGLALTDRAETAIIKINPEENVGIDALSKELDINLTKLLQTKAKIKALITNQKIIRGIGNVYADEILWEARISPFSISSAIPEFKIKALSNVIKKVLTNAEKQLWSKQDILLSNDHHDFLKIYGKAGEKSPTGSIVKIEKKGGHSTYFTDEQVVYK